MNCVPPPGSTDAERKKAVDLFYDQGSNNAAKRLCFSCPAQLDCIQQGLHEQYGVWGGLAEGERRQLRALLSKETA